MRETIRLVISRQSQAKVQWDRDFAHAFYHGPGAIVRQAAVCSPFTAALLLTHCGGFVRKIWGRAMRAGLVAGCVALVLVLSGCGTLEEKLIQEGIGTELPAEDMAESTRRLEVYLTYLCAQAGGTQFAAETPDASISCDMSRYGSAQWSALVSAGFNDIDRRCDSYLAWLASRRRDRDAIINQIHDTRTFTEALMYTTGVGAAPIAIAGLAFGIASSSFTNYYSRLVFEIEKSTVSVLVREKRLQYRDTLNVRIVFQPDAVHVLREYMLICTPFYIEDLVNQRTRDSVAGHTPADKGNAEQIRRSLVAGALINAIPKGPRDPLPGTGNNPTPTAVETKMAEGVTDTERSMPKSVGRSIQSNLCVAPSASFDDATRNAIQQAKVGANESGPAERPFKNTKGQIASAAETQIFFSSRPCNIDMSGVDRGYHTSFEKFAFAGEAGVVSLQQLLALCDPNLKDKFTGKFDSLTRAAIKVAKTKVSAAKKAGLTDPDTDTLNDKSYNAISLTCR